MAANESQGQHHLTTQRRDIDREEEFQHNVYRQNNEIGQEGQRRPSTHPGIGMETEEDKEEIGWDEGAKKLTSLFLN